MKGEQYLPQWLLNSAVEESLGLLQGQSFEVYRCCFFMWRGLFTKVGVYILFRFLVEKVVSMKAAGESSWTEMERTEVVANNLNPRFVTLVLAVRWSSATRWKPCSYLQSPVDCLVHLSVTKVLVGKGGRWHFSHLVFVGKWRMTIVSMTTRLGEGFWKSYSRTPLCILTIFLVFAFADVSLRGGSDLALWSIWRGGSFHNLGCKQTGR